jgi:hypothetical protein
MFNRCMISPIPNLLVEHKPVKKGADPRIGARFGCFSE